MRAAADSRTWASDDDANPSWSHPQVLAILAVVFLLGTVVGIASTHMYLHARVAQKPAALTMRLNALKARLHLTPEQENVVTKELDDYAKYYQNIEEERVDVAQHGKQRILTVLTPEQQKRFTELFDQLPH